MRQNKKPEKTLLLDVFPIIWNKIIEKEQGKSWNLIEKELYAVMSRRKTLLKFMSQKWHIVPVKHLKKKYSNLIFNICVNSFNILNFYVEFSPFLIKGIHPCVITKRTNANNSSSSEIVEIYIPTQYKKKTISVSTRIHLSLTQSTVLS